MQNLKNKKIIVKKGFTLMELLVSMVIFCILVVAVSGAFAKFIAAQRKIRAMQTNLETAQFVMASLAKSLRTSSVEQTAGDSSLNFFDYSRGMCIRYQFDSGGKKIMSGSVSASDLGSCVFSNIPLTDLTVGNINNVWFSETKSDPSLPGPAAVGKATIAIDVCSNIGCSGSANDRMSLQTTVSLRDYNVSGL